MPSPDLLDPSSGLLDSVWWRLGIGLGIAVALWAVGRLAGAGVRRRYRRRGRPSFANVMSRVVALALALLGFLAAVTVVFPTVQPVNVLGSLGFFSIAVGFAFRDILENLLAGMLLLFRAPFRTGDEVEIEGTRGVVREINLRETVIRTYDGRRVLIPNATVYKNPLVVQTGFDRIRTEVVVGVAYGTDLQQARELALDALGGLDLVHDDPAPLVLVDELGVSTVDLRVLFWHDPRQAVGRRTKDAVLEAVVTTYDGAGIEMPADILEIEALPAVRVAGRGRAAGG